MRRRLPRQGDVPLLDQVGDRLCEPAQLGEVHLELLIVLVGLLELVNEPMQTIDLLHDVAVDPPHGIDDAVGVGTVARLDHNRAGEELELARVPVQFLEKIREVLAELTALDPFEPVRLRVQMLRNA